MVSGGATNNFNLWSGTDLASSYDPYTQLTGNQNVFSLQGDLSAGRGGILSQLTQTGSTGNGGSSEAIWAIAQTQGTGKAQNLRGVLSHVYVHGSGTVAAAVGNNAYIETAVGGATITSAIGFQANGANALNGGTITTLRGMRILNGLTATGGTIGNQIGIEIASLTAGSTNHAIITGASGDVQFGYLSSGASSLVLASTTGLLSSSLTLPANTLAVTQTQADNSTKVATTAYVDEAVIGQRSKEAVKYASVAALPSIVYANGSSGVGRTLTGVALAAISLDGASPGVGDRVLIKNQVAPEQNGIYVVTQTGSGIAVFILTGATDFDQSSEIQTGDTAFVTAGNTLANTSWAYTGIDSPTMGTTALTFAQVSADLIVGSSAILSGTTTRVLYDNAGALGEYTVSGSGNVAMTTSPSFTTPILGTPTSGDGTNITGITAAHVVAGTFGTGAYTMDTSLAVPQIFNANNAITASSNAATVTRANRTNTVTNNSAATLTITLSTSGAQDGDMVLVRVLDASAVAQTLAWVNTENSSVSVPTITNGSTTLPLVIGFQYNANTSKWRCIAVS